MKLLVSFVVFLTIVNIQLTTGENNYNVANLKTIHKIIDTVKTAKDIWNIVKDLPPTFADVLQTISKLANQKNSTKQDDKNASSNNTNRYDGSKMRQSSYDFVIDLTRPTDIYGELKAYPLSFPRGKKAYDDKTKPNDQVSSRFIVNVIGRYNVGKTYILRLLGNIDLVHSFTERTNGISVSLPNPRDEHDPSLALIDTAGSRTPVDYNSETFSRLAYEKQISDAFIQEIALNSSEIFLVVLNQLTLDDQLYLKMLRKRLKVRKLFRSIRSRKNVYFIYIVG
jgi:predicted GTPase